MNITLIKGNIQKIQSDVLIGALFENEGLSPELKILDRKLKGSIKKSLKANEFSGQSGKTLRINTLGLIDAKNILIVGVGPKKEILPS